MTVKRSAYAAFAVVLVMAAVVSAAEAVPSWTSPDRCRLLLTVDPRGVTRKNSPATVDVDLPQALAAMGVQGTFDESTIEVVGYDSSGAPRVFDESRAGYERFLLPWRVQRHYAIGRATLSFVMPDHTCTEYAVYFDTEESGHGRPQRYAGLVGDGDFFREGYGRREINANHFDDFCDFDGDGDLDLLKAGVEPYIYYYENVGGNRYVDRGRLTSNGSVFRLPASGSNRSWLTVEFADWDDDGDQDLFASFGDGPHRGQVRIYENTTVPGGPVTFTDRGYLRTESGNSLSDGWFAIVTVVDWDGDGIKDVLSCRDGIVTFHKNLGPDNRISSIRLADGVYLTANGQPLRMDEPRVDCADIDGDGDLDLFCATQFGAIYWFENVGTRTKPVLAGGRIIVFYEAGASHSGVKVADFDGDGLLDIVAGRLWENTHWGEQPRFYGRLYKNIGTPTSPKFEVRDASNGSPYTEQFQMCDAVRQNSVQAVDWDNDGLTDLIASDTDGFIWFFRNTTNHLFPVFAPGEKVMADGKPLKIGSGGEYFHGYARVEVCDWNSDGRKDLLIADTKAWLWLFLNQGTDAAPVFGPGTRVSVNGVPIDGSNRGTALFCDWEQDGKKDVVFADDTGYYFYRNIGANTDPVLAAGKPILFNGQKVTYNRPNLGAYVDWDGDGKKDLIGCEFENSIRFYRNIGSGAPNTEPRFADKDGVAIVLPHTVQMISGADAKDWNRDGDIDIVTGQGHAGSGLRFYERDYINDFVNNTYPVVSTGASEKAVAIADAKSLSDGTQVLIARGVVTGVYGGAFYVGSKDRVTGIRVQQVSHGRSIGDVVDVRGALRTNSAGERYIVAASVVVNPF